MPAAPSPAGSAVPGPGRAQLAWRCRRGLKELDVLLLRWLETRFETADAEQRALFATLLELPDPQLLGLLLGTEPPQPEGLAALLDALRG